MSSNWFSKIFPIDIILSKFKKTYNLEAIPNRGVIHEIPKVSERIPTVITLKLVGNYENSFGFNQFLRGSNLSRSLEGTASVLKRIQPQSKAHLQF